MFLAFDIASWAPRSPRPVLLSQYLHYTLFGTFIIISSTVTRQLFSERVSHDVRCVCCDWLSVCTGATWDTTAIHAVYRASVMSMVRRVRSVRSVEVSVLVNPTMTASTVISAPTDTTTSQTAHVSHLTYLLTYLLT